MITVEFTRDITLPRFTMKKGDTWKKRPENITDKGFKCGCGFVHSDHYRIVKNDE